MRSLTQADKRIFGDYQTPLEFSDDVCAYLKYDLGINPEVVIEPTCGFGNFLFSALKQFDSEKYFGIEINKEYIEIAASKINDEKVLLYNSDFFSFDFKDILEENKGKEILIIGNPPWVNVSTSSVWNGDNLPTKTNFKEHKGLDAITGSSNFDISEYIILDLINTFENTNTTIALLCKTLVSRNVFLELKRKNVFFDYCKILQFDARKIFDISADSCLLCLKLSTNGNQQDKCDVFDFNKPNDLVSSFEYKDGKFYSDFREESAKLDGHCCLEWRQGVKHDCSKIMELSTVNGMLLNGKNEHVDIEEEFIYPLIKSSNIKTHIISSAKKSVIVTQKKIKEDTQYIQSVAPRTWKYLNDNLELFRARKSSIYRKSPEFSMFGIGDYTFSRYKVAISGFYKKPLFSLLHSDKPIILDDTCYFLSFDTYELAYVAMVILNSSIVGDFLKSIVLLDAKRPYTKKILERIDFSKILELEDYEYFKTTEKTLSLPSKLEVGMFDAFKKHITELSSCQNSLNI